MERSEVDLRLTSVRIMVIGLVAVATMLVLGTVLSSNSGRDDASLSTADTQIPTGQAGPQTTPYDVVPDGYTIVYLPNINVRIPEPVVASRALVVGEDEDITFWLLALDSPGDAGASWLLFDQSGRIVKDHISQRDADSFRAVIDALVDPEPFEFVYLLPKPPILNYAGGLVQLPWGTRVSNRCSISDGPGVESAGPKCVYVVGRGLEPFSGISFDESGLVEVRLAPEEQEEFAPLVDALESLPPEAQAGMLMPLVKARLLYGTNELPAPSSIVLGDDFVLMPEGSGPIETDPECERNKIIWVDPTTKVDCSQKIIARDDSSVLFDQETGHVATCDIEDVDDADFRPFCEALRNAGR